ncbi:unnamed protein product, partial [Effrenium voratum]
MKCMVFPWFPLANQKGSLPKTRATGFPAGKVVRQCGALRLRWPFHRYRAAGAMSKVQRPDVFEYNQAISAKGRWQEARQTLMEMLAERVAPDTVSFNACITPSPWSGAMGMFAEMQQADVRPNIITYNASLQSCKGAWQQAVEQLRILREKAVQKDTVTHNIGSSACAKAVQWQKALDLLDSLQKSKLQADVASGCTAVKASGHWRKALVLQRHNAEVKLETNLITYNCLMGAVSEKWQCALEVLRRLGSAGPHAVTSSIILSSLGAEGLWQDSLQLLGSVHARRLHSDIVAYNGVMSACDIAGQWSRAGSLLRKLRGLRASRVTHNTAISASRTTWQLAYAVAGDMALHGLERDLVTMTSAVSACGAEWLAALAMCRNQQLSSDVLDSACVSSCEKATKWQPALAILDACALSGDQKWEVLPQNGAISACGETQRWELALQVLQYALHTAPDANSVNAAITVCGRASQWQAALRLLAEAECNLVRAQVLTYNASISACEEAEQWKAALDLFDAMSSSGLEPDLITYNTLVSACRSRWRLGQSLLRASLRSFNALGAACAKALCWSQVLQLLLRLPEARLAPSRISCNAAMAACKRRWRVALARFSRGDFEGGADLATALEGAGKAQELIWLL